jgi:MYXO-CTERM domain-containing protein
MPCSRHHFTAVAALGACVAFAQPGRAATVNFIILRDDGALTGEITNPSVTSERVMKVYAKTKLPRPDVLSVWTTFTVDGTPLETLFAPQQNDVEGIGLEAEYPTGSTFDSPFPPLRAILLHNDVTKLAERAQYNGGKVDGLARYLFLLELSHLWGPAIRIPGADAGVSDALIGFPFHWSFWMSAGGSPAGGNDWKDNGDGTFTTSGQSAAAVRYSMLDLYLMGLADPAEVPPFGILESSVPPSDVKDPFNKRAYSAKSFPWFGDGSFTAKASRREVTIDDVIATNGPRVPDRAHSPSKWNLGIVLWVGANQTEEEVLRAQSDFAPIAASFAPAFKDATRGRGTLEVITTSDVAIDIADGGTPDVGAEPAEVMSSQAATPGAKGGTSGCAIASPEPTASGPGPFGLLALLGLWGAALRARVRRRS